MSVVVMILSAIAVIAAVRYGLLAGLDEVAGSLRWSAKVRGQVTGLATSVPELVTLVSAGLAGVWEAGLWNVASSNIINAVLMVTAVLYFRQWRELKRRQFIDEVVFGGLAVAVPVVLMGLGLDTHWLLVPVLYGFFVVYRLVDRWANAGTGVPAGEDAAGSLRWGLILGTTALVAIAVAGTFLGGATKDVVDQLGLHPALAGWILGLVTSLPELVTFFAVYSASHDAGTLGGVADTQEVLDNLTSSNMANVGLVYPTGLLAFLLAASLLS